MKYMKQMLVMMAVSLSVVADEVVITDPVLKEELGKKLKKPYGKFAPPMKLAEADLAKVTGLSLTGTQITDEGLKEVAKLQKLETLNLSDTKITDTGLKDLAKLQKLKQLWLSGTKITDAGLKEVAKLQKLEALSLRNTKITDAGLKEVAKLQQLTNLNLYNTKITNAGLKEVAKLQQLTTLDLGSTKITYEGLKEVAKLQQLKELHFDPFNPEEFMEQAKLLKLNVLIPERKRKLPIVGVPSAPDLKAATERVNKQYLEFTSRTRHYTPTQPPKLEDKSWLDVCPFCIVLIFLPWLFRWLRGFVSGRRASRHPEGDIKEQDTPKSLSNAFEPEKYTKPGPCPKCGRQLCKTPAGNWFCMNC